MSDDVMTVGELIELLQAAPQDAIVMVTCSDEYYSGPVAGATSSATAVLFGPHGNPNTLYPYEDAFGNKIQRKLPPIPGGWTVLGEGEDEGNIGRGPVLDRRPAFVLWNP